MMRLFVFGSILLAAPLALADEPPTIDHHPIPCTVPAKAISLCAAISDDQNVSAARVYFRRAGEDFYSFVDMTFGGINYCGTLPAPREGKLKVIEYYVQAVDDQFQAQRTSTFQLSAIPTIIDCNVAARKPAELTQALLERCDSTARFRILFRSN